MRRFGSWGLLAGLSLIGCVDRIPANAEATGSESESESETGAPEPELPSGDTCTLELVLYTSLPPGNAYAFRRPMFAGSATGGFLLALTDPEREVYILRRYGPDGALQWTVDTVIDLSEDGGGMLELADGVVAIVASQYVPSTGWVGRTELHAANGELIGWPSWDDGGAWTVIGPQDADGFACAGDFAYRWDDINGMSMGVYDGETLWRGEVVDTDRRLSALLGFDGRTFVVDRGCAVDELDPETRAPVAWAACTDPSASLWALERLAGGQLIAGGVRAQGPYVQMFGPEGEPLASWTSSEGSLLSLTALADGGVVVASAEQLRVLDDQLELVRTCALDWGDSSYQPGSQYVYTDDHGGLGIAFMGGRHLLVARVHGLTP